MAYQPSKKELKQIENLNKGYRLVRDGLKIIKDNLLKKDGDVEMQAYKMSKNFDKIIKRIKKILEKQYIDKQFINIINNMPLKRKDDNRFNKRGKKSKKRTKKRNKPKG